MAGAAGLGAVLGLVLRRDRLRIAVWALALGALAYFTVASIEDLYPTQADLAEYAATVGSNQAVVAMSGPARGLDTFGGRIVFELWPAIVAMALLGVFAVPRHTRAEEETGRSELLRSTPLGRHATSLAALLGAAASCAASGAATTLGLVGGGLPWRGAAVMGTAFALTGTVFAAATLVAAQVTGHSRAATGLGCALVGAAYVTRAVGDVGNGALSWLSPLGWAQASRPFTGDRWWPLGLALAATGGLAAVAIALEAHRDHGAGVVHPRPGPSRGAPALTSSVGLAWRLHRSSVLGWVAGLFLAGVAFGSVVSSADDFVGDNEDILDYLAQVPGVSITDLFLATLVLYLALAATGFVVSTVLAARSEEVAGRVEPLLATALSRGRWAGGHALVAALGSVVALAVGGAGLGLAYGVSLGEPAQVPRVAVAALTFIPAVWAIGAVAWALVGLRPSWSGAAWGVVAVVVALAIFGPVVGAPQAVLDLSPFTHAPQVPADAFDPVPVAVLVGFVATFAVLGAVGLRRRDVDA